MCRQILLNPIKVPHVASLWKLAIYCEGLYFKRACTWEGVQESMSVDRTDLDTRISWESGDLIWAEHLLMGAKTICCCEAKKLCQSNSKASRKNWVLSSGDVGPQHESSWRSEVSQTVYVTCLFHVRLKRESCMPWNCGNRFRWEFGSKTGELVISNSISCQTAEFVQMHRGISCVLDRRCQRCTVYNMFHISERSGVTSTQLIAETHLRKADYWRSEITRDKVEQNQRI
jgi:hypothetical protein